MSYVAKILYAEANGQWIGTDQLRFTTEAEAEAYLADLRSRRGDVLETRVVEHTAKPTSGWDFKNNALCHRIKPSKTILTFRS